MLTETGRVVAVETQSVWVETIRQSTCGACAAQKGCGHGLINKISDGSRSYIKVLCPELQSSACKVDDQVRISIPEEVILKGSFVVYMIPLLTMLLGAALSSQVLGASSDLVALAGAVAGFVFGILVVRIHAWHHRDNIQLQPTLLEVLKPETMLATSL